MSRRFDRPPSPEVALFLIGIQSKGLGYSPDLDRAARQRLVEEGARCAVEALGLLDREATLDSAIAGIEPGVTDSDRERLLKLGILEVLEPYVDASGAAG